MRPVRQLFYRCIPVIILSSLAVWAAPAHARSSSDPSISRGGSVQISHPVLAEALKRLEETPTGAPIARYVRYNVKKLYFFDPDSPLQRRFARYDGIWNRTLKEIGIRNTYSGGVTDYLASLIAHEGAHAMNASVMSIHISQVSSPDQYASHMIDDEVRAYQVQIRVWEELRAGLTPFERMLSAGSRGDTWLKKLSERESRDARGLRRWIEVNQGYGRTYRNYWKRVMKLVQGAR